RVGRQFPVQLRADVHDQPQHALPAVLAVRVVQQDEPPGSQHVGRAGHLAADRVRPRREPLRRPHRLEEDLAAGPDGLQRRDGVDAAILFSDIVVPLKAAGVDIDIVPGTGPVVAAPVRDAAAVRALPELKIDQVSKVAEGVGLLVERLGETPLIGFAGAPFTLASYLIEGGPSRNHEHTKALMHSEPALWHDLAGRLADLALNFLRAQLDAGVDAILLFGSWAR